MLKRFFNLLKDTVDAWSADKASRQAAALAYYSIFTIAPFIVLLSVLVGQVVRGQIAAQLGPQLTPEQVQQELIDQIGEFVGPESAAIIADLVVNLQQQQTGPLTTIASVGIILFAVTGLIGQLQTSLDIIWNVAPDPARGVLGVVIDRFLAFALVLVIGGLLLLTLILRTFLTAINTLLADYLPESARFLPYVDFLVFFLVITILFAMVYKILTRVSISWRDVWIGAAVTSLLFNLGTTGISFYLGNSSITSAYGAAGSFVVILVWIYYSAQIFLLGAEFTKVYASQYGSRLVVPAGGAIYRIPVASAPLPPPAPPPGSPAGLAPADTRPGASPNYLRHAPWLVSLAISFVLGLLVGGERR